MTSRRFNADSAPAYLPQIEWDGLRQGYEIDVIDPSPAIPAGARKISVERDSAYRIHGTVNGDVSAGFPAPPSGPAGRFARGVTITGANARRDFEQDDDGNMRDVIRRYCNYELPDCYLGARSTSVVAGESATFLIEMAPWRISRSAEPLREVVRLTEWYLNGPQHSVIFPRSMHWHLAREYKKEGHGENGPTYPDMTLKQQEDLGYASISYDDKRFLVYDVPQGCGPDWSHNIGIEYRPEWGGLPSADEREAIGEIVSFVVGRRLVHVGYTSFDLDGWPVEEVSYNPWGDNVIALCGTPDRPPTKLVPWVDRGRVDHARLETTLARLVAPYIELRAELGLKDVLWHYWLSREAAPGIDFVIISTALEGLITRWLKSNKSKAQGVYLPKDQFDNLTQGEFAVIEANLDTAGIVGCEFIMRSLRDAFQIRGAPVRRNKFLDEIQLPMGSVEEEAFRARNPVAHGGGAVTEEDHRTMIRHGTVYRTALARIILKLLGYNGMYMDYSAPDFPETPIDQPQAGWSDDEAVLTTGTEDAV